MASAKTWLATKSITDALQECEPRSFLVLQHAFESPRRIQTGANSTLHTNEVNVSFTVVPSQEQVRHCRCGAGSRTPHANFVAQHRTVYVFLVVHPDYIFFLQLPQH